MCMQLKKKLAVERGTDLDLYTNVIVKLQALALTSGHEIMIIFYIFSCLNSTNGRKHTPPPPPTLRTSVEQCQGVEGQGEHVKGQVFMSRGLLRVHFFKICFAFLKIH